MADVDSNHAAGWGMTLVLIAAGNLLLAAGAPMRPATAPIGTLAFAAEGSPRRKLVVLLPGRGSEFSGMITGKKPKEREPKYLDRWYRNHPDYIQRALQEWRTNGQPAVALRKDQNVE